MYRIGVDVGGTFTDFVLLNTGSGAVRYWKVPSTPEDPSIAIGRGIGELLGAFAVPPDEVEFVGHGTTVATNMILERRGSPTGLLTTRGFRDVLAIGRQTRPSLYDYSIRKPAPLVERHRRVEIDERLDSGGQVLRPLSEAEVAEAARVIRAEGVESVAICFLHAYRNQVHEEAARRVVRSLFPDLHVSISSEVLPEFREYERTSTTVLNAYVMPRMRLYLDRLQARVADTGIASDLLTVHSNGGLISLATAKRLPVLSCLSGPAAGVVGAARLGAAAGLTELITFDVGGTSTDVSLVSGGRPQFTSKREIDGLPLKMPMIDIQVIGAGGGSIAEVDDAGGLKVGPRSAGAVPGPASYAKGGNLPTLTDANICLRRLNPTALLDGQMPVDRTRAIAVIEEHVARPLGLSVEEAAYGMIRIATANMSRAIRSVSVEHGHDLRHFVLVAFGGAGPLHAAEVAAECGLPRVLVPPEPGTMCARGILMSDISLDFVRTALMTLSEETWPALRARLAEMLEEGQRWLERERIPRPSRRFELTLEARYRGQTHEIPVRLAEGSDLAAFARAFGKAHEQSYGYDIPGRAVEIVNCRVRAVGEVTKARSSAPADAGRIEDAETGERPVYFGGGAGWLPTPIYRRLDLPARAVLGGPAVIEEMSSTTLVLPGQKAGLDGDGNIMIDAEAR